MFQQKGKNPNIRDTLFVNANILTWIAFDNRDPGYGECNTTAASSRMSRICRLPSSPYIVKVRSGVATMPTEAFTFIPDLNCMYNMCCVCMLSAFFPHAERHGHIGVRHTVSWPHAHSDSHLQHYGAACQPRFTTHCPALSIYSHACICLMTQTLQVI